MSTQITREHTFDGIQEFDNRLPDWWLWTFYLACIFSLLYWMHFHVLGTGDLPQVQFRDQIRAFTAAQLAVTITDEELVAMSGDAEAVGRGQALFVQNCSACHGPDGGARSGSTDLQGPNLTDGTWLHGGSPNNIRHTITHGVAGKQMQAWGLTLGVSKVNDLTAFVLSLRNSNVANGKAPEGEPYQGDD